MKILLVGEYSRLHNSLKEGLLELGHQVDLVGDGDSFKNFPVDYSIKAKWSEHKSLGFFRRVFQRITGEGLPELERGLRMWQIIDKFKNYDVVQLINERPIKTTLFWERKIVARLKQNNQKLFLLSAGVDYHSVSYQMGDSLRYSILDPYKQDPKLYPQYIYALSYITAQSKLWSQELSEMVNGIIASDIDYVLPLKEHPKFLGLIPNPITIEPKVLWPYVEGEPITIFLGINRLNYHSKGIVFFENALKQIQQRFADQVRVIVSENLPYQRYIEYYNSAHIVLDQVYSYDQGYNALEAMAKGKVVFTGAETEFLAHYHLQPDEVCINTQPDVDFIVEKLSHLIVNPSKINDIASNAVNFIKSRHYYFDVAQNYLKVWSKS